MKQNWSFLEKTTPSLEEFSKFLLKWQKSVNLISPKSIPFIWERHVLDSAQLYPLIPQDARVLLDMGSGGGFPGLVLALLNKGLKGPLEKIVLVESDSKKCIFLTEAARVFDLPVIVLNKRMEKITSFDLEEEKVDVITARALAPISVLLELAQEINTPQTTCLFLKGEQTHDEITNLPNHSNWDVQLIPSATDETGVIVQMRGVLK